MSFDIFTLSIVGSSLSILGAITMYSQLHILSHHPSLRFWMLGGIYGSLGFLAMLFYLQLGAWAVFISTLGSLLNFYYLYIGVKSINRDTKYPYKDSLNGVWIITFIAISWLIRDEANIRFLTHDALITFLSLLTISQLWTLSDKGNFFEFRIALGVYFGIMVSFLVRFCLIASDVFSTGVIQAYNDVLFLMVIFWVCGWIFGFSLILQKKKQRNIEEKLLQDELTGLLNRSGIMKVAGDWIANGTPFHLYVLDLNGFKKINDTFGHTRGDEALKAYTQLASNHLPPEARFARIGGDEFVIISSRPLDMGTTRLKYELSIGENPVTLDAAIGQAAFPKDGNTLETLFLVADDAMYVQKYST